MRYIYYGKDKNTTKHNGIVCAGYEFDDDSMKVAVTFCSPEDKFNKKTKVHEVLPGRMAKGKFVRVENFPADTKYEKIAEKVKELLNEAVPEDYATVEAFVKDNHYKVYPKFAGINLPFWFKRF